jgi:hypothetical protein
MNREWKNRKVHRPPIGVPVEVTTPTGQGTLSISIATYTGQCWEITDRSTDTVVEYPLDKFEVWRDYEEVTT